MTKELARALQFKTSFENVDTNPYFESFYADFERWSFHLQIYFLAERFKEQKRIFENGGGFIQDRSIYEEDRKSTRLNSSHVAISYAVFCLKKKKKTTEQYKINRYKK